MNATGKPSRSTPCPSSLKQNSGYNIGRFAAALGPAALGLLTSEVFTPARGYAEPMRWAGMAMCSIFLFGIVIALLAPETKGKPLPE